MTDKEKIKEQVNIYISNLRVAQEQGIITRFDEGKLEALEEIADFIDSLQEEPVSENFEEAADNAFNKVLNTHEIVNIRSCMEMFKYGAQWKEKEMQSTIELAEDHAMLAGMEKMKEQMMKDAIDVEVHIDAGNYPYIPEIELYDYDKDEPLAKSGDKYKVVLIKED